MMTFGLVLGVLGVFGVVWTTFLISRSMQATYGRADAELVSRAASERMVPATLRWFLRGSAAVAALGSFLVIRQLLK